MSIELQKKLSSWLNRNPDCLLFLSSFTVGSGVTNELRATVLELTGGKTFSTTIWVLNLTWISSYSSLFFRDGLLVLLAYKDTRSGTTFE